MGPLGFPPAERLELDLFGPRCELPELPRFFGGAVGYLGYDMVRFVEQLPNDNPREIGTWDSCFLLTETLLIFDNMRQTIKVVCNVHLDEGRKTAR